jgi:hypothetical protein
VNVVSVADKGLRVAVGGEAVGAGRGKGRVTHTEFTRSGHGSAGIGWLGDFGRGITEVKDSIVVRISQGRWGWLGDDE